MANSGSAPGSGTAETGVYVRLPNPLSLTVMGSFVSPVKFELPEVNRREQHVTAGGVFKFPKPKKREEVIWPDTTVKVFIFSAGEPMYSPMPKPSVLDVTVRLVAAVSVLLRTTIPVTKPPPFNTFVKLKAKVEACTGPATIDINSADKIGIINRKVFLEPFLI